MHDCGIPRHYPVLDHETLESIGCPCDVGCPKCNQPASCDCVTPTGYHARWHRHRIIASKMLSELDTDAKE